MSGDSLLVTGANGHLGRDLIGAVGRGRSVRAVVRSERAARSLDDLVEACQGALTVHRVDYADEEGLRRVGTGCEAWVHLVGILKESRRSRYEQAHEATCTVLGRAATKAGARRVVYLSILGSHPDSPNRCLASKGRAEQILAGSGTPTTTLRVPMVLGPREVSARALLSQALAPVTLLVRGGATLEQPLDVGDLVQAILAATRAEGASEGLDLAGPEYLSHRELLLRVAALLHRRPRILPIPLWVAQAAALLAERVVADPPITRDMLDILERDDCIDPDPARSRLGIDLSPLDRTLHQIVEAAPAGSHP